MHISWLDAQIGWIMIFRSPSMKIPAVILAAGASKRLGQPKQLIAIQGESLIHRMARIALQACEPVLVVLGSGAERMKAALGDLPVRCVNNLDWEEGMASSLRAAVSALPPETRAATFLVCDQPALDQALLEAILHLHQEHPGRRIASAYAGIRGIPALLPCQDFDAILRLRGDRGAKGMLLGDDVLEIPFPGGEVDLDRPEDLIDLGDR
jgi:molybdenum cofactor cytidylyltransferase